MLLGPLSLRKYTTVSLFLFAAASLSAQTFTNGQAARAEFGQYTFTFGGATPTTPQVVPNQQILGGVSGLAWANGTLYVADSNRLGAVSQDNRVVMFNTNLLPAPKVDLTNAQSYSNYLCNVCAFPAFNQLGQPTFNAPLVPNSTTPDAFNIGLNNDPSQPNMRTPTAVATDGNVLAVADTDNNRVLIWTSIPTAINQAANIVLGQTDFTHATVYNPPTASSLLAPQGVWIQNGKLYVADTQNYRVLIWNSIPTSNNQPADLVLGQSNFNTGTQAACSPTQATNTAAGNELCNPVSVTSDGAHVFVSDLGFNRVLIWNNIPASNGQNADVVLGQPDMTSTMSNNPAVCKNATGTEVQCESNLNFPRYALSDGTRLFVADGGNDRVLIFNTIPTQNGAPADNVLGQADFVTNQDSSQSATIASTALDNTSAVDVTPTPTSLAFDGLNLYVSDAFNNRVLVFTPADTSLPDQSVLNWASQIIRQEGFVNFSGTITANDTVSVTIGTTAPYTYTIKSGDTLDTVAQGEVALINANSGDPNAIASFSGAGSGSLYLTSRATNPGLNSIALSATSSNTADITALANGTTAASYLTAGTAATGAPGMLVEVNGTNLSDQPANHPAVASLTGAIPTSLGGTQVFMDGIASPVFQASATQVVSQIPFGLATRNSTSIFVRTTHNDGSVTVTNATPIYIAPANPGIFDAPATLGQARPFPASGALHQPGNPQAVVDLTGTVKAGDVLTITVGSTGYNYTVQASDSLATLTAGLAQAVNSGNDPSVTAQIGAAFNRVVIVARQSGAAGNGIAVATSASTGASITLTPYTSTTCCDVVSNSPITADNPAAPGETITLRGAGLGQVSNLAGIVLSNAPTGQPYTLDPINSASNSVSATLGGTTAQVVSAGFPQGSYGIYQVQIIVPSAQATNPVTPLYIAQNAFISNTVTIPVGPANANPNTPPVGSGVITIDVDNPSAGGSAVSGSTPVNGWVVDKNALIQEVQVSLDGQSAGTATYGESRPDACAANASTASCANGNTSVGYSFVLDTTPLADGAHTLQITATDAAGTRLTHAQSFTTANYQGANPNIISIDNPGSQGGTFQGLATVHGWAISSSSTIGSVTASVDGVSRGSVTYGQSRPDVCAVYPTSPSCQNSTANVGWSYLLDTSALSNGDHLFSITATASNGQRTVEAHPFTVANWTTANSTLVTIDYPSSQTPPLSGTVAIGGWAINPNTPIASVAVAIDNIPMGAASYGANRSDVCAVFSTYAGCPNVGWNFALDTTLVGDGSHTLQITVTPVSGQAYTQTGPIRIGNQGTSSNPTLISIDQPNASTPALAGFVAIGGWALNDSAAISTVQISIDGVPNGLATYGSIRNDVCAQFPGNLGCPNVGWNYAFNTATLANGPHLLEVTANTSTGQRATTSSSFTVANSSSVGPTSATISHPNSQSSSYQGMAVFSGTAVSTSASLTGVNISVDGYPFGAATFTPAAVNASANWTFLLNTTQLADGPHTLGVTATAADGTSSITSSSFQVANWTSPSPTQISIDVPNSSSASFSGSVAFGGWALNPNSAITAIQVSIDDVPAGTAQYGGNRGDVCSVYPNQPGCPNVGWNFGVDTTYLANGTHTLAITAITAAGQSYTTTSSFTVAN